jgi:ubiquinone/menaquinone biosynthesis C-methylase UbiE
MKLNWAERLVVNNPSRVIQQQIEIHWLRGRMPFPPGARILEIGCGRGAAAKLIVRAFQPSQLHIQDLDIRMIRMAKRYLSSKDKERILLHVSDACYLPFKDCSLDAIFGFGFLHHVPDWRRALFEIARVLKAGGIYYMEELYPTLYQNFVTKRILLHPEHDRFRSHDLKEGLNEVGLNLKDAIELKLLGILAVVVKKV